MKRRQWLKNDFDPSLVRSVNFAIEESPVQLVATGLALLESIPIEVRGDAHTTLMSGSDHHWAPLYRNGMKYELRGDNNQVVILIPGVYRIAPAAAYAAQVTVSLWEDETPNGERIRYTDLPAPMLIQPMAAVPLGAAPPCASPPVIDMDYFHVHRTDAATGEIVTLVYGVAKANNAVCPPVPAGAPALVGHIPVGGAYVPGAYPGMLGGSGFCSCAPGTSLGVLTAWG